MNWIKQNTFLAGYFAVLVIGVGALAFLLFSAKGKYEEVANTYETQAAELHRLQTLPLFPSEANRKKLDDQRKAERAKIDELQRNLAAAKLPIESMTPEQFQDKLKASVTDFSKKAADAGLELPKGFYMGFDRYQSIPPKPEAAPLLGRELRAIELVLNEIPTRAVELKSIKREELPEEGLSAATKPETKGQANARGPQGAHKETNLVSKHAFEVDFLANAGMPQLVLNSISSQKQQVMIPRLVVMKNEKLTGPSKVDPNAPATGAPPAPTPQPPTSNLQADALPAIIVGDERIECMVRVDIVDVADLPAAKAATPK